MENYTLVHLFWAIAVAAFPVCALFCCFVFKNEIKKLLNAYIESKKRCDSNIVVGGNLDVLSESSKTNVSKTENLSSGNELLKKEIKKLENNNDDEFIFLDVCKNKNNKKYFIIIDEDCDETIFVINPEGRELRLKSELFDDGENIRLDHLYKNNLLTKEQITAYKQYIEIDTVDFFGGVSTSYRKSNGSEPSYIKSYRNMLNSSHTWPSKMLNIIRDKQVITKAELKGQMDCLYDYSPSDNNGSFHASLRLLLVDNYVTMEGAGDNKVIRIKTK